MKRIVIAYAVAVLGMVAAIALSGCSIDSAYRAKGTIAVSIIGAVESWQEYDYEKQKSILDGTTNRFQFEAKIKAYRDGEQAKVVAAFRAARHALGALDSAIAAYEAGKGSHADVTTAVAEATKAAAELVAALNAAGVKISNAPQFSPDMQMTGTLWGAK
jgi:hypothetical protein